MSETYNVNCYHCAISLIAQRMAQSGAADFKRLIGDLMQTAAEIAESQPLDDRTELKLFAEKHFRECCVDAREAFDGGAGIGQPPAGHA